MESIKVFISYSWDGEDHRAWVKNLADSLEEIEEVSVTWDGYDLDSLVDKNFFMESGIHEADYILVVATENYKEKADERKNGVGLETFLASAVHWDGMLRDKRSKIIIISRDPESTPNYLKGHFHLDFADESQFHKRFEELLRLLQNKMVSDRPRKRRSISTIADGVYDFSRFEEVIQVNYPNRRAIVGSLEGTDFSGGSRVKYELWETKSPALSYFLALHASGNIRQSVQHAARQLLKAGLRPADITVLRPREARPEQDLITRSFAEEGLAIRAHECTYKEYIWEYCIDASLKKIEPPSPIENYTNQAISYRGHDVNEIMRADSALDFIVDALQKTSGVAAHLIVAPGGMGKTSLCLSVAQRLHFREDLRSSVILIQAELIKRYVAESGLAQSRIDSIYDLYELYAKCHGHLRLFERSTFDLAVVCGNLSVIIDGLDELTTLFQERFDVSSFLESLKYLHDQLGSSHVLLTTRNNAIAEGTRLESLAIERYELLGFDAETCQRYVKRRLSAYPSAGAMIDRVMSQIEKIKMRDEEGRIIPFLADISATVVEDGLREGKANDFEVSEDATPYRSNNRVTDHIIFSVLRREATRHDMEIPVVEVVELLSDLAADFGKRWPAKEMSERLQIMYEARAASIQSKLCLNPLLTQKGDQIELRYSFLGSYFELLLMLRGLGAAPLDRTAMRTFSRLDLESEESGEIKLFFRENAELADSSLKSMIPSIRDQAVAEVSSRYSRVEIEHAKSAMSNILDLYFSTQNSSVSDTTERLFSFFDFSRVQEGGRGTITGLHLKGEFPVLDFSGVIVTQSRFQGYRNFMSCRFRDSTFMYSVFEECANLSLRNTQLEPSMIDSTCDIGDLRDAFAVALGVRAEEKAMISGEVAKFWRSFYRGNRFVDNRIEFIKFSSKVPGIAKGNFNRLVASGYFVHTKAKVVADFYEIAPEYKSSVRKFLSDGYPDGKMRKFISFVS
ncbi:TIR domain-containing protein [Stenotrophomonas maltophilia]|uniref:TIR domain-containing protein n=1 Tax=Stenotrophomonas maltophilia TaxID=40324 RepID=UPI00158694CD|nr:TIR domain-containing protein [Stenotrophomonas maltophilia]